MPVVVHKLKNGSVIFDRTRARDSHVLWNGRPKIAHPTREAAERAVRAHAARGSGGLVSYLCDCTAWHVGNVSRPPRSLHSEPALLVELGDRALAQLMRENELGAAKARRQIANVFASAARKAYR